MTSAVIGTEGGAVVKCRLATSSKVGPKHDGNALGRRLLHVV